MAPIVFLRNVVWVWISTGQVKFVPRPWCVFVRDASAEVLLGLKRTRWYTVAPVLLESLWWRLTFNLSYHIYVESRSIPLTSWSSFGSGGSLVLFHLCLIRDTLVPLLIEAPTRDRHSRPSSSGSELAPCICYTLLKGSQKLLVIHCTMPTIEELGVLTFLPVLSLDNFVCLCTLLRTPCKTNSNTWLWLRKRSAWEVPSST